MSVHPFPPGAGVVAYLRDSGGATQDLSVPQQEQAVREWCHGAGLSLAGVYADVAKSGGSTRGRAQFDAMVQHFQTGAGEAGLVIWSYARLARDIDDGQYSLGLLRRAGYQVYAMIDPVPAGALGRVVESLHLWRADEYRKSMSDEIKRGQRYMIQHYKAWMAHAPPGVGYTLLPVDIGPGRDGRQRSVRVVVVDQATAPLVKLAFSMRAEGRTYKEIHDATGLQSFRQGYGYMFRNELYRGVMSWAGDKFEDFCEPLVDADTWARVQAINRAKEDKRALHPRRALSKYLLSGLLRCGVCGGSMIGSRSGRNNTFLYYACNRYYSALERCAARRIRVPELDSRVMDVLRGFLLTPDVLAAVYADVAALAQTEGGQYASRRARLLADLSDTAAQIDRITLAVAAAGHSAALLDKLAELERKQAELRSALAGLREPEQALPVTPDRFIEQAALAWAAVEGAQHRDKQVWLRGMVDHITVTRLGRVIQGEIVLAGWGGLVLAL